MLCIAFPAVTSLYPSPFLYMLFNSLPPFSFHFCFPHNQPCKISFRIFWGHSFSPAALFFICLHIVDLSTPTIIANSVCVSATAMGSSYRSFVTATYKVICLSPFKFCFLSFQHILKLLSSSKAHILLFPLSIFSETHPLLFSTAYHCIQVHPIAILPALR